MGSFPSERITWIPRVSESNTIDLPDIVPRIKTEPSGAKHAEMVASSTFLLLV